MPTAKRPPKPLLICDFNPDGSDEHRLCRLILEMRTQIYLAAFDRVNLCSGKWSIKEARLTATKQTSDKRILLGSKACAAHRIPYTPFERQLFVRTEVLVLPHPSGLCRLWNDGESFIHARMAVADYVSEIAHLLGTGGND